MDWYSRVERAYEMDLEEIRILADVARYAPPHVAHHALMIMMNELMDAMHWHMMLMMRPGFAPPPFGESPFGQPPYGTQFNAGEKKAEDK
ncbi:hypothetical protein [Thermoanaerobacterium sp. DL9XJH110]|jgi:hypothetical protein|uniref:hypothetical protein n=1 Tax=Thermoanaerobacterium sp. DL9XJH110 TaxID=3386643 RepID=UPI003BB8072C